ncbi:MAG: type I methionyl aminopeptidase [Christensenellaceae bacterium]|jgi:methionyl aminopeptidase|nr:type I methionyl aminopeptidase [Christensenellaceae bacterium]
MVYIKRESELNSMRKAGLILRDVLELVQENAKVGVTTKKLDTLAYDYIKKQNATPSFLGYLNFPATLCISIDDEVVHGVPGERVIEEGMLVKIDAGVKLNGFHTDAARTIELGAVSDIKHKITQVCKESFFQGIAKLKSGVRLGEYSHTVQQYAESAGFSVVRVLGGHGIGRTVHEDPFIPNFGLPSYGLRIRSGMTMALEPMINAGTYEVSYTDNGTVITADGSPSAHYENTIIVTDDGVEIITL